MISVYVVFASLLCFACVKCFTLFQIEDWWICGPWYVPVFMVNPTSTLSVRRISLENETFRLEYLYISKDSFFFKFHFQLYNEKFKLKSFIFKWNSTYSKRWRRVHHEFWYVSRATNPPTLDLKESEAFHTRETKWYHILPRSIQTKWIWWFSGFIT